MWQDTKIVCSQNKNEPTTEMSISTLVLIKYMWIIGRLTIQSKTHLRVTHRDVTHMKIINKNSSNLELVVSLKTNFSNSSMWSSKRWKCKYTRYLFDEIKSTILIKISQISVDRSWSCYKSHESQGIFPHL